MSDRTEPSLPTAADQLLQALQREIPDLVLHRDPARGAATARAEDADEPFAEVERSVLRVTPLVGDRRAAQDHSFVNLVTPS